MRPVLRLEPFGNSYHSILLAFKNGSPLTNQQINFLRRYQTKINDPTIDAVCKYYGISEKRVLTLNLKKRGWVALSPKELKEEITCALQEAPDYELQIDLQHLLLFKALLRYDLIFFTNNPLLLSYLHADGLPHLDFFQWDDLLGVIKYDHVNVTIHFENKCGQNLADFALKHRNALIPSITVHSTFEPQANTHKRLYEDPTFFHRMMSPSAR